MTTTSTQHQSRQNADLDNNLNTNLDNNSFLPTSDPPPSFFLILHNSVMLSLLAAFFLPALIAITSVPPVYGFTFGFSKQFEPSVVPLNYKFDVLAETLEKVTFPSSFHKDPAYASMLVYLNSLESKPSCHRTATASFISDCSALSDSSRDIDLRYHYAAQLAICEFEATGVRYPDECKGLSRKHKGHKRCIKRLEERPQWWTTLSNNIQNALMLCKAMGQQVEKGMYLLCLRPIRNSD